MNKKELRAEVMQRIKEGKSYEEVGRDLIAQGCSETDVDRVIKRIQAPQDNRVFFLLYFIGFPLGVLIFFLIYRVYGA